MTNMGNTCAGSKIKTLRILFEACTRKTVLLREYQLEREAQVPSGFRHRFGKKINVNQKDHNYVPLLRQS